MDELKEQFLEWYKGLEQRERRIMLGGAAVVFIMLVYFLLWKPIVLKKYKLEQSTQEMEQELAVMKQQAEQVKVLKASSAPVGRIQKGQSLLGIIDRSAKSNQLAGSLKRVKPDGQTKARVWLENAKFNDVIRWVENLKRRYNVDIENASFEKQEEAGVISGRFVFLTASE